MEDIGYFYVLSDTPDAKVKFDNDPKAHEKGAGKASRLSIDGKKALHKNIEYTFAELKELEAKGKKILNFNEAKALMQTPEWAGAQQIEGGA